MGWGERELKKYVYNSPNSQEKRKRIQTVRRKMEESEVYSKSVIGGKRERIKITGFYR